MKAEKYTISFVNKGEPFEIPTWTVTKHNNALSKLAADQTKYKWDNQKTTDEFKFYVIYETLSEIDTSGECTLEKIRNMHTTNVIELFNTIYLAGKEEIHYIENFRKGRKTPSNKK